MIDPTPGWTRLARQRRVTPTRRALLHVALGMLLYAAGANVAAGWVVALGGFVAGVVPWAAISAYRAAGRIDVRRTLPALATAGAEVSIGIEVHVRTHATVIVHDHLTAGVGTTSRGSGALETRARLRRGVVPSATVRVAVTDLFGLVRATAEGVVSSASADGGAAVVLPAVVRAPGATLSAAAAQRGEDAEGRRGAGAEVVGVRGYLSGDPLRAVHWRSSARRGSLVVRQLADTARPRVAVELAAVVWEQESLDRAIEACGALATVARGRGHPVEVAADGRRVAWGRHARRHLATVPPHAGAPARALQPPPQGRAEVTISLAPAPGGVAARIDGVPQPRVLPGTATAEEVAATVARWGAT